MEKDCKSCKHDGNQMFYRTACTGCGADDIRYQHWEAKTERDPNAESVSANPLLSDVIGLYISDDGMVILAERRHDGDNRLAGRVVYQTEAYRNRFPNDIPIGTFSNKWDENAFNLLVK